MSDMSDDSAEDFADSDYDVGSTPDFDVSPQIRAVCSGGRAQHGDVRRNGDDRRRGRVCVSWPTTRTTGPDGRSGSSWGFVASRLLLDDEAERM